MSYLTVFLSNTNYPDSNGNTGSESITVPQYDVPDYPFESRLKFQRNISFFPSGKYSMSDIDRRMFWSMNYKLISRDSYNSLKSIFEYSGPITFVFDPYNVTGSMATHSVIVNNFKGEEVIFDAFNIRVEFSEVTI